MTTSSIISKNLTQVPTAYDARNKSGLVSCTPQHVASASVLHETPSVADADDRLESQDACRQDWAVEVLAKAFSRGTSAEVKSTIRTAIERVPYHGLWSNTSHAKPRSALLYGQLGQDLVRSLNNALGQYVTAEKLGLALNRCYKETCRKSRDIGLNLTLVGQEYNMVFFMAPRLPTHSQASWLQENMGKALWRETVNFFDKAEQEYPHRSRAIEQVRCSLSADIPLINLGIYGSSRVTLKITPAERITRYAIGASAAAKIARSKEEGYAFADPSEVLNCLKSYRELLEAQRGETIRNEPVVITANEGYSMLNPSVLSLFRAKKLEGKDHQTIAQAVSLLNCLDWVQQSRYSELSRHQFKAAQGRKLTRLLGSKNIETKQLKAAQDFCLENVPYLSLAQELQHSSGTLFWIDMKKLAVRCHIIREREAMALLDRVSEGESLGMEDIVDSMIAIDMRVQDARDVLPGAAKFAQQYLDDRGISHVLQFSAGGDDAAFYVHHEGQPLPEHIARGLGHFVVEHSEKLRLAYANVTRGSKIADEICRLDRILAATKLD